MRKCSILQHVDDFVRIVLASGYVHKKTEIQKYCHQQYGASDNDFIVLNKKVDSISRHIFFPR